MNFKILKMDCFDQLMVYRRHWTIAGKHLAYKNGTGCLYKRLISTLKSWIFNSVKQMLECKDISQSAFELSFIYLSKSFKNTFSSWSVDN